MSFSRVSLGLALAASVASAQYVCLDEYECIFHYGVSLGNRNSGYSWDFRSLCKSGGEAYRAQVTNDPQVDPNAWIEFNVCGRNANACAPQKAAIGNMPVYSRGVAIQVRVLLIFSAFTLFGFSDLLPLLSLSLICSTLAMATLFLQAPAPTPTTAGTAPSTPTAMVLAVLSLCLLRCPAPMTVWC
jgi:hypothetical protein